MPRFAAGLIAAVFVAGSAAAQSTRYWPQLDLGFPVPQAVLDLSPKPVKLRLYAASAGGRFEKVKELAIDRLEDIPNRKPGFQYVARGDGEEEFAVQLLYADGTATPAERDLKAEFRVVFDTRPPAVNLEALGNYGVQWRVSDDNLDTASLKLECRWVNGDSRWHEVKTRAFAAKDDYTWASLKQDNRTLEVRLTAKDKAGHESVSRIVRLPDTTGTNGRRDFEEEPRNGGARSGSTASDLRNSRSGDEWTGAQSQIVYVNRRDLTVKSKLTHITRSGVTKLHLYVKDMTNGSGGEWKFDKTQPCDIKYEAADTNIELPFTAAKDGRYGFIVIPESGVGRREPEPRAGTPPQHFVEVDTVKPVVKVRTADVTAGTKGPRVEIVWDADDANLWPDPIVIEYADSPTATKWTPVTEGRLPNSRRYVWNVEDLTKWKVVVRVTATDKAGNTGTHILEKDVILDLDKPSATIEKISGTGSGGGYAPSVSPTPLPSSTPAEKPPLIAQPSGTPVTLPSVTPGGNVPAPDLLPSGK